MTAGPPSTVHNNQDLLVWSLHLLGGADRWVDVEDLYLQAFELAPARLAWRTKPDIPDYKKCAKALQSVEDAKRGSHPGLFQKQGQYLRKLTMDGVEWCATHASTLERLYGGEKPVPSAATQDDARRIKEVESHPAFTGYRAGEQLRASRWDLAETFRCLGDSPPATWTARFDEVEMAARRNGRDDVVAFVTAARRVINEEAG